MSFRCGVEFNNISCEFNYCCSKWGWCGTSTEHCSIDNGCNSTFGKCSSTSTSTAIGTFSTVHSTPIVTNSTNSTMESSNNLSVGCVIGIIIGCVVVLCLILLLLMRRRKLKSSSKLPTIVKVEKGLNSTINETLKSEEDEIKLKMDAVEVVVDDFIVENTTATLENATRDNVENEIETVSMENAAVENTALQNITADTILVDDEEDDLYTNMEIPTNEAPEETPLLKEKENEISSHDPTRAPERTEPSIARKLKNNNVIANPTISEAILPMRHVEINNSQVETPVIPLPGDAGVKLRVSDLINIHESYIGIPKPDSIDVSTSSYSDSVQNSKRESRSNETDTDKRKSDFTTSSWPSEFND